jgi:hypothetical protein
LRGSCFEVAGRNDFNRVSLGLGHGLHSAPLECAGLMTPLEGHSITLGRSDRKAPMRKKDDAAQLETQPLLSGTGRNESGWKSRGLGMMKMEQCGCRVTSYPGGYIYRSGCSSHQKSLIFVCPVCALILESRKLMKEHRYQHAY